MNQIHTKNVNYETSSTTYSEDNIWELIESLEYRQSSHAESMKTSSIVFLIFMFVLGVISSIGVVRWYTKKSCLNEIIKI